MSNLKSYITLSRPGYWTKNIAIIPGMVLAFIEMHVKISVEAAILSIVSACCISASNYIMNEYLDRATDRYHPVKKKRVLVHTPLNPHYVILEYLAFLFIGLIIAFQLGYAYFLVSIGLLVNGIIYNLYPMRTKDRAYIDVLVESFSNPMRFLMGWYAASESLPFAPGSILLSYWFFGTYLMCMKRKQELQKFNDMTDAVNYRGSYATYTPKKLLIYALLMLAFSGIFFLVYGYHVYPLLLAIL